MWQCTLFVSTWQWWATKISVQYIFDASGSFPVFFHAVGSFFSASRLRDKLRGSMRIARRKLCLRNHIKPRPTSGARYPFPSGSKTHLSCQNIRWSFQSLRSVHLSRIPFSLRILSVCVYPFAWKNDHMTKPFRSVRWSFLYENLNSFMRVGYLNVPSRNIFAEFCERFFF